MVNQVFRILDGKEQLLSEVHGTVETDREAEYWSNQLPNEQIKIRYNVPQTLSFPRWIDAQRVPFAGIPVEYTEENRDQWPSDGRGVPAHLWYD